MPAPDTLPGPEKAALRAIVKIADQYGTDTVCRPKGLKTDALRNLNTLGHIELDPDDLANPSIPIKLTPTGRDHHTTHLNY